MYIYTHMWKIALELRVEKNMEDTIGFTVRRGKCGVKRQLKLASESWVEGAWWESKSRGGPLQ